MKKPVYLDYAATTPVDPRVAEKMAACLTTSGLFANPASSSHLPGREARGLVELARAEVADLVGADLLEIVFTSGATESDNLAIKGAAHFNADRGKHVVTCRTEHKAVLDTCKQLGQEGFDVTYLVPDCSGILEREQIADALRSDTVLVSFMHVNNETGVVHDISAIGALCRERGVLFHVDAAQSTGKLPIDLSTVPVDLMSFSAHKIYGPKGIGALYVRREPRALIEPQMHGGGHERGLRSGTLATHQIVGMGDAFRIAGESMAEDSARIRKLRDRLWEGISELPGVYQNGCAERRVCGVLNASFEGVEGESLLFALRDLAVSSGSACTSATKEPSYVLRALGCCDQLAQSSIRFSVGRFTTEEEIEFVIPTVCEQVQRLRDIAPSDAQRLAQ